MNDERDMEPVFMGGGCAGATASLRLFEDGVFLVLVGVGDAYIILLLIELWWPSPSSPNGLVDRPAA